MIDTTKLKINTPKTQTIDPYQQQPPDDGGQDWQNFDWLKNYYGGNWYDFGAKEGSPGWWRAPRINPAGAEAVWNQNYGWQDWNNIANLGGDYSSLSPQWGDVYDIYGGYNTQGLDKEKLQDPNNQGMSTENIGDMLKGLLNPNYSDLPYYPSADVGPGKGFQYPEQWGTASDVMTNFAQGDPTQVPWQWSEASEFGQNMMQEGMPVDVSAYKEAMAPVLERQFGDMTRQMLEEFGMGGLRWSTPVQGAISREGSRLMENYGLGLADRDLAAQESARQRQMQASNLMYGLGGGISGLGESARNRALQAAGGLSGLGQQYLQAPQDWAQQMWGMGSAQQDDMQLALDKAYQDFMRMAPEYSPWLSQLMGYVGLQPQVSPQQYGQSGLGSLFGGLLSMLGLGLGAKF